METPVIDFHTHSGRWGNTAVFDDPKRYVEIMDAAGVDRANINCIFHSDASKGNNIVAERFVSQYPDRFIGVAFVTPHYPEEAIPELERAFNTLNLRSLKVYPTYYGKPIDDPGYFPIFEWCNDRGITLMSHSSHGPADDGLTIPTSFIPLAQKYTNMNWVLARSVRSRPPRHAPTSTWKPAPPSQTTRRSTSWSREPARTVSYSALTCLSWTHGQWWAA